MGEGVKSTMDPTFMGGSWGKSLGRREDLSETSGLRSCSADRWGDVGALGPGRGKAGPSRLWCREWHEAGGARAGRRRAGGGEEERGAGTD